MTAAHAPRRSVPGSVHYAPSESGSWVAEVTDRHTRKRLRVGRFNTKAAAIAALYAHAARQAPTP